MAEMRDSNSAHKRARARRAASAAAAMRSNREQMSRERGHIYLNGQYAPEPVRRPRHGRLTQAEIDKIRQLRGQGMSQLAVACELDLSPDIVGRACREHNIPGARLAQGGWAARKEEPNDQIRSVTGRRRLLADHDAGLCDRTCRLGRHGLRPA